MTDVQSAAERALEKELTCSICTEVVFQPLALIECLHTFCGSCLKEWFLHQASTAQTAHPYTCPSCRAPVRSTQRHHMMTSLLEQFLQAHPGKDRTPQEKEDMRKLYKPGDQVLPKLRRRRRPEDENERRLMEDVRLLSLQESGATAAQDGLQLPATRHQSSRSRSGDRRERRQHRSRESSSSGMESRARPPRVSQSTVSGPPTARQVAHQASLRSLLSVPGLAPGGLEQAIVDRIVAQNLLDGFDLDHMDPNQEEEVQARILSVFRQITEERQTSRQASEVSIPPSQDDVPQTRQPQSEQAEASQPTQSAQSRPPVSRPHLFDTASENVRHHRRRNSSQGTTRTTTQNDLETSHSSATHRGPSRSTSDLLSDVSRPPTSAEAPRRGPANPRRTTDPEGQSRLPTAERTVQATPERRTNSNPLTAPSTQLQQPVSNGSRHATFPVTSSGTNEPGLRRANRPAPLPGTTLTASPPPSSSNVASPLRSQFVAVQRRRSPPAGPSVNCNRCQKTHIEYQRHYHCEKCPSKDDPNGGFNLCLSCYRQEKGCKHWFGFSRDAAEAKLARMATELPEQRRHEAAHVLPGRRWRRVQSQPAETMPVDKQAATTEDLSPQLETGAFCDSCDAFANSCYWKCETCNDGAWGFCNDCVNQSKHCTHPLLPLSYRPVDKTHARQESAEFEIQNDADSKLGTPALLEPSLTPRSAASLGGARPIIVAGLAFAPQSFTTECDVCHFPIQPSQSRYHCSDCNSGDYDVCTPCYSTLVSSGRVKREDGPSGWRRCPKGHRMSVIGFEDRDTVQWRVVVKDRVGGLAFKEEGKQWSWLDDDGSLRKSTHSRNASRSPQVSPAMLSATATGGLAPADSVKQQSQQQTSQQQQQRRYPPSGGVGLVIKALYPWWPEGAAKDELMFPRGAEIREAENINEDWYWGCYAGAKGLFPGGYGRVIGHVE